MPYWNGNNGSTGWIQGTYASAVRVSAWFFLGYFNSASIYGSNDGVTFTNLNFDVVNNPASSPLCNNLPVQCGYAVSSIPFASQPLFTIYRVIPAISNYDSAITLFTEINVPPGPPSPPFHTPPPVIANPSSPPPVIASPSPPPPAVSSPSPPPPAVSSPSPPPPAVLSSSPPPPAVSTPAPPVLLLPPPQLAPMVASAVLTDTGVSYPASFFGNVKSPDVSSLPTLNGNPANSAWIQGVYPMPFVAAAWYFLGAFDTADLFGSNDGFIFTNLSMTMFASNHASAPLCAGATTDCGYVVNSAPLSNQVPYSIYRVYSNISNLDKAVTVFAQTVSPPPPSAPMSVIAAVKSSLPIPAWAIAAIAAGGLAFCLTLCVCYAMRSASRQTKKRDVLPRGPIAFRL